MINNRQVEAFRAVMLTGGMTSAAELLGVTQPAVSRLVRGFEDGLGLTLFERRGNAVTPTPNATLLLTEVERSFVGLSRIEEMARAIRIQAAGTLRIAAMPALVTSALPRFIGDFLRRRRDLRVSIQAMPSHMVVEAVGAGQADFGYALGPLERPGFEIRPVEASAAIILPAGHRLVARSHIVPADLEDEDFVSVAPGTLFNARVELALAGIRRRSLIETSWFETACVLVAQGAGTSIVDPFSAREFVDRGVAVRRFEPRLDLGLLFLRLPHRPLTPLAATFIRSFSSHLKSLEP